MATASTFAEPARRIVSALGGADNIKTYAHCATRLRTTLIDPSKVDDAALDAIPEVLSVIKAGGQHQIVIGNDVPVMYQAVSQVAGMAGKQDPDLDTTKASAASKDDEQSIFARAVDLISALFVPIIWVLAGTALGKALLTILEVCHLIDPESTTYTILATAADSAFYFLPLLLALSAARRFHVNEFIAITIVGALLHPNLVELTESDTDVTFLGIPVPLIVYASSVIPAIIMVWVAGYVQRYCEKILPGAIRNFGTPLVVSLIMVPLTLLTIGPATIWLSELVAEGIQFAFTHVPWLAGAIMGGFWQLLVVFGLHWGVTPLFINDLATTGESLTAAITFPAVLGQAAAAFTVLFITKNQARKKVAGPASVSGFLAGITEPAVYGVNLPLKVPFIAGSVGAAVGGALVAMSGSGTTSFVFASLLTFPVVLGTGNFVLFVIANLVTMAIASLGTLLFARRIRNNDAEPAPAASEIDDLPGDAIVAPVAGPILELADVPDPVFSSGSMGAGFAVKPDSGTITAPVSGTIIVAPESGHAFGIKTDDGVEVLVHVGIDTVKMKGAGFTPHVSSGDKVHRGDPLVDVDLGAVEAAGYPATIIVVVTNQAKLSSVERADEGPAVLLAHF